MLWQRPLDWPEDAHLTGFFRGPITDAALPPQLESFLGQGQPPVYATFGSLFPASQAALQETSELLIEAARQAGRRLILQRPGEGGLLEDDVLVVERCPHAAVFPRCAAVVHHGGAGTTQTALFSGAASVIVPHVADQFFWSKQLSALQVAVSGPPRSRARPSTIAAALGRAIGDAPMRARAAQLGAQLREEDGLARALTVIEDALKPQA